ncbi:hypothetical protein [Micromonospora sp. NPDC048843]|uniref:hypothetical protein n=1 Tax=Micromonospora sp. NPDC048843 TaxID=3155389 RepID=UPI00340BF2DE
MKILASAPVPPSQRLNDADTTDLTAIQRPTDARWPINQACPAEVKLLDGEEDRALWDSVPAADLALIQAAIQANPAAVRELADAIHLGDNRYAEGYADGLQRALAARPAGCPSYCTEDHRGFVGEVDGFSIGLGHEVVVTDLTADDPATTVQMATARVLVESCTERGEVTTPTRVVLSIAAGSEGHYPGGENVQGWSGTPDEVEQLAHAMLAAARIARHA